MIGSVITNEMLRLITEIEENRRRAAAVPLPDIVMNRLRKNSCSLAALDMTLTKNQKRVE